MTQALSAAIASAEKLPPEEQDALAAILLEELAGEAICDFEAGRTQPLEGLE